LQKIYCLFSAQANDDINKKYVPGLLYRICCKIAWANEKSKVFMDSQHNADFTCISFIPCNLFFIIIVNKVIIETDYDDIYSLVDSFLLLLAAGPAGSHNISDCLAYNAAISHYRHNSRRIV